MGVVKCVVINNEPITVFIKGAQSRCCTQSSLGIYLELCIFQVHQIKDFHFPYSHRKK